MVAGAIFGILIYFLAYLPIHDKPNYPVRSLIITLAINIATIQILLFLFGKFEISLQRFSLENSFSGDMSTSTPNSSNALDVESPIDAIFFPIKLSFVKIFIKFDTEF